MKLLGTNEVCEILGISKPTLYRWNNLSDESLLPLEKRLAQTSIKSKALYRLHEISIEDLTPKNFPRPFKIGRAYKWRSDEIENWLETMRI